MRQKMSLFIVKRSTNALKNRKRKKRITAKRLASLDHSGGLMSKLTCFKAYDIRGRLGDELNADIVYRIGRAFGQFLKPKTIVVGGDVRLTSKELKSAVT